MVDGNHRDALLLPKASNPWIHEHEFTGKVLISGRGALDISLISKNATRLFAQSTLW